jgi:hypothetical protein
MQFFEICVNSKNYVLVFYFEIENRFLKLGKTYLLSEFFIHF